MNDYIYTTNGLYVNRHLVKGTLRYQYQQIGKRVSNNKKIKVVLTEEISLSGNAASFDKMFAFHPAQSTICDILKHTFITSGLTDNALVTAVESFIGKDISTGPTSAQLHPGELLILVYKDDQQPSGLDFMISYGEAPEND